MTIPSDFAPISTQFASVMQDFDASVDNADLTSEKILSLESRMCKCISAVAEWQTRHVGDTECKETWDSSITFMTDLSGAMSTLHARLLGSAVAEPKTETGVQEASEVEELILGEYSFQHIPYDAMEPGDVICTYESVSTVKSILVAISAQKTIATGQRKKMHKMLHFEVILAKKERKGMYEVAHASGHAKKVVAETQNFKSFDPGQAVMVFRAKDPKVRDEIIEVARATAKAGNPWGIPLLEGKGWAGKMKNFFAAMRHERARSLIPSDEELEKIAEAVIDASGELPEGANGFYGPDGETLRTLSCVQYVTSVVNSAMLRGIFVGIVEDGELEKEEKVAKIVEHLKKLNLKDPDLVAPPLRQGAAAGSATGLVDFMLSHPNDWDSVGYVGSHAEGAQAAAPTVHTLSKAPLGRAGVEQLGEVVGLANSTDLVPILQELDLLSSSSHFNMSVADNAAKRQAAFVCAKARNLGIKPDDLLGFIIPVPPGSSRRLSNALVLLSADNPELLESLEKLPEEYAAFDEAFTQLVTQSNQPGFSAEPLGAVKPLSAKAKRGVLRAERHFIKSIASPVQRNQQLSINYVRAEKLNAKKRQRLGVRFIAAGLALMMCPPVGLIMIAVGAALKQQGVREEKFYTEWENRIQYAWAMQVPNTRMTLISDVGVGNRPWVTFSVDGGKTWDVAPLTLRPGTSDQWEVDVRVDAGLEYKYFIGPDDPNHSDPISEAKAWQQTENEQNVQLKPGEFPAEQGRRTVPRCDQPTWS